MGNTRHIFNVKAELNGIRQASQLTVTAGITGTEVANTWNIWVYPAADGADTESFESIGVIAADAVNDDILRRLSQGESVLLTPSAAQLKAAVPGRFFPVFWSPVHFTSAGPCGICCEASHPVFGGFPTDGYASYQWKEPLEHSFSVCLDKLPGGYSPIVAVIPNFYHNHRLAALFEAKVGGGRLLVCSVDIENGLDRRPAAKQLRRSIFHYMQSAEFHPSQRLEEEQIRELLTEQKADGKTGSVNLALHKPAATDSEQPACHGAEKGNDGSEASSWRAADTEAGHWWQVDLGSKCSISGTKVVFEQAENYLYVIQVSDDGKDWRLAVNKTGQTGTDRIREDVFSENARYVRIVYNGLPSGLRAGHCEFEVF